MYLLPQIALDDPNQLREQHVRRSLATRLRGVSPREIPGQLKDQLLEAAAGAVRVEVHAFDPARPYETGSAPVVGQGVRPKGVNLRKGKIRFVLLPTLTYFQ